MANNRLTWRDVTSPNYSGVNQGIYQANKMFQDALGGLSTSLGDFATQRQAQQDKEMLDRQIAAEAAFNRQLAAVSGDTEATQALLRTLGSNSDVRGDFIEKQIGTNRNTWLTGDTSAENLRRDIFNNEVSQREQLARERAQPLQARILQLQAAGYEKEAQQLQAEYESLIADLSLEDQEKLFKAGSGQAGDWQNRRTSETNRNQTNQNIYQSGVRFKNEIDDRTENRLVEDIVGTVRAESPFIDEQQAIVATAYRNGDISPRVYERINQQLQRAASGGGTGGGDTRTAVGGTPTGGGSTLVDPIPSPLDPSSPYSTPETQDIVQDVNNLVTDLTRGAGTVASRGVQRSDSARATDISPSEAVARVMKNKAFENADPVAVQNAIYEVMNMSGGNFSYAESADVVAMSPSLGRSLFSPSSWFNNTTYNPDLARNITNQWTSSNLGRDRETLQEISREQTALQEAEERINRKNQKLNDMINHAFRNGLSQDSPAIRDLQEEIQLDIEDLRGEAERIRGKNLGERIRNPATGGFDYPANIREEEARAARSRAEAQAQAEEDAQIAALSSRHLAAKDAQRIRARMKELEDRWGKETLMRSRWTNGEEYRSLIAELNRANRILQGN